MANARQAVVDAIKARLLTIVVANGYRTDCGARVFNWRKSGVTPEEMPCLEFKDRDGEISLDGAPIGRAYHGLKIEIEAFLKVGAAAVSAREAIADIMQAIGADEKLSGACKWITPRGHELDLEPAGDSSGGVFVVLDVVYETAKWGA